MPPLLNTPSSSTQPRPITTTAAVLPTSKAGIRRRNKNAAATTPNSPSSCPDGGSSSFSERQKQLYRLREVLSGPSRAIAPIAIIGGTFSVYSSAIKLSNSNNNPNATDFTPLSILYLFLLALNYAVMPRLSKKYIHPNTNKQSVALAEEVVKMSLGVGGWVISSYVAASNANGNDSHIESLAPVTTASILFRQLENWSATSTLLAAGLPSALYALQGTLTYTAYQNLDAVTFNGLTQLKVLSSAFCCYMVLGKQQSMMQMVGLGLLMTSTVVFQGSWKEWFGRKQDIPKAISRANDNNRRVLLGVLPCLAATLLSGLAGAFSQKSLQTQVGMMHRDPYFYTVELSFLSAVCLVLSMGMEWWRGCTARSTAKSKDGNDLKRNDDGSNSTHFFQHWTYATLLPITTKATAGLLTALVHRHLGSVIKGFALVLGLVFSALLQFVLEGVDLRLGQLVGTALVLVSSWLHFTNPVRS